MAAEPQKLKIRKSLLLPVVIIVLVKLFSLNQYLVEQMYSNGVFYVIGTILRKLTGWIPFSIGDIFYCLAGIWILLKCIKVAQLIYRKEFQRKTLVFALRKIWVIAMWIYVMFNMIWGLNYNRKGIAYQLHFSSAKYDSSDLKKMVVLLIRKVNANKNALIKNGILYPGEKDLFERARKCYELANKTYPFLFYNPLSVKSSLYSEWGNYLGFTGYYNPFSGEAQVNTTVPKFILPYTTCHEMAHQIGYAKEDEANFVGYLAATSSHDTLFLYSTYLDLLLYANRELAVRDPFFAYASMQELSTDVKTDLTEYRNFLKRYKSFVEPAISWAYSRYLKANQQPHGMRTYSEVVGNLIEYFKKFGRI
ncbi:MAG: DUF3810 domain-containing protein [Ginsengibacter sp.]